MNTRVANLILLAICLGLTGTLVFTLRLARASRGPAAAHDPLVVTNTVTQTQIAVRKIHPSNLLAALANRPLSWGAIESTNYATYIANLRSIGCPEETIKDIILTDVAKVYARRRGAVNSTGNFEFWRTESAWEGSADPQKQELLRLLEQEQTALVRELLDVDYQTEISKYFDDGVDYNERIYSFLPEEKRGQLFDLQSKYDQMEQAIYARSKGVLLAEDEAELQQLQRDKEQQMAALLTPQEMEEYGLRNSPTAATLRSQLHGFEPSEEEFRRIYRVQKAYDDALTADPTDPAAVAAKARAEEAASVALNDELRKTLGDKRYQEYVRAQDDDYRHLLQLSQRLELPPDIAGRVYDMRQTAELQKQRVENDPNLTFEQRQRALAALAQETERALSGVMGSKPFGSYRQSGASWLNELREPQLPLVNDPTGALAEPPPLPPGFPPLAPFP